MTAINMQRHEPLSEFEFRLDRSLFLTRLASILGGITGLAFLPLDSVYHTADVAPVLSSFRIYYILPVTVMWFAITFSKAIRRYLFWIIFFTGIPIGWSFIVTAYLSGPDSLHYSSVALTQVCYFAVSLLSLPTAFATIFSILTVGPFWFLIVYFGTDSSEQWLLISAPLAIVLLGVATTIRTERREKTAYRYEREIATLRRDERELKEQRIRWLQSFSDFIRHECRDAFVGAVSSLRLLEPHTDSDRGRVYIERAEKSLSYARRLLAKAAEATSVESAVYSDDQDRVDVTSVARETIEAYRDIHPDHQFLWRDQTNESVMVDGDLFQQLVEKILGNAVEHSDMEHPISVRASEEPDQIVFCFVNSGEPLPEDTDRLFELFKSSVKKSSDNLGLGLYIAKTIAEGLGGWIDARSTSDPTGAEFRVGIPKEQRRFRRRHQTMDLAGD
ncbi:MAG: HAMP domain-containing sensor histidine kinase [Woeseiaceae bacterium]|nr:HAMP domain-containing sensor histidine kinase [Woeseiaceae bacterium]